MFVFRSLTTWMHQIYRDTGSGVISVNHWWSTVTMTPLDTGVTATEALQLAQDKPFWSLALADDHNGGRLRLNASMMMMMFSRLPVDLSAQPRSLLFFVVDSVCLSICPSVCLSQTSLLLFCFSMESSHFSAISSVFFDFYRATLCVARSL